MKNSSNDNNTTVRNMLKNIEANTSSSERYEKSRRGEGGSDNSILNASIN